MIGKETTGLPERWGFERLEPRLLLSGCPWLRDDPAPPPFGNFCLDPASDTGPSDSDGITQGVHPRFLGAVWNVPRDVAGMWHIVVQSDDGATARTDLYVPPAMTTTFHEYDNGTVPGFRRTIDVMLDVPAAAAWDWLVSSVEVALTQGEIYYDSFGTGKRPNPAWLEQVPTLEFDTYKGSPDPYPAGASYAGEQVSQPQFLRGDYFDCDSPQTPDAAFVVLRLTVTDDARGTIRIKSAWEDLGSSGEMRSSEVLYELGGPQPTQPDAPRSLFYAVDLPTLDEGRRTVTATVVDAHGNVYATEVSELVVDRTAPAVTAGDLATNQPTATLTGTVSDPTATVILRGLRADDYVATNHGTTWSATVGPKGEVGSVVWVTASDAAGNSSPTVRSILKLSPGWLPLTIREMRVDDGMLAIEGRFCNHPDTPVVVQIDGVDYATERHEATWSVTVGPLPEGTYTVRAVATDADGNTDEYIATAVIPPAEPDPPPPAEDADDSDATFKGSDETDPPAEPDPAPPPPEDADDAGAAPGESQEPTPPAEPDPAPPTADGANDVETAGRADDAGWATHYRPLLVNPTYEPEAGAPIHIYLSGFGLDPSRSEAYLVVFRGDNSPLPADGYGDVLHMADEAGVVVLGTTASNSAEFGGHACECDVLLMATPVRAVAETDAAVPEPAPDEGASPRDEAAEAPIDAWTALISVLAAADNAPTGPAVTVRGPAGIPVREVGATDAVLSALALAAWEAAQESQAPPPDDGASDRPEEAGLAEPLEVAALDVLSLPALLALP